MHGKITDSSALFTPDKGSTNKEFWTNVSTDWKDAVFAVVGTPFDRDATPESLRLSGEPEAAIIAQKLRLSRRSSCLEIGAGVGRIARHIAPCVQSYTGADITKNMLEIAAAETGGLANCRWVELPETGPLPFPDAKFDAVYAQAVFIHLDREDCWRYIRETFRVLAPGGRAYFQFYNLLHPEGFAIFDWVSRFAVTDQGRVLGRVRFETNVEVRRYVEAAGFVIDERASHLAPIDQEYDFPLPMLNYDYYLIAVADKPADSSGAGALLDHDADKRRPVFSDRYYTTYIDGFLTKAKRADASSAKEFESFLARLDRESAFRTVHEIERAVLKMTRLGRSPVEILPVLREAASKEATDPFHLHIRRALDGISK